MESKKLEQYKIVILISFIYNKYDETYQFFSCNKAYYVKRQDFSKNCFEHCVFYVLDTDPEPEP